MTTENSEHEEIEKKSEDDERRVPEPTIPFFGNALEMQLSTLVSALEIGSPHTAGGRAVRLLRRLHMQFDMTGQTHGNA